MALLVVGGMVETERGMGDRGTEDWRGDGKSLALNPVGNGGRRDGGTG